MACSEGKVFIIKQRPKKKKHIPGHSTTSLLKPYLLNNAHNQH